MTKEETRRASMRIGDNIFIYLKKAGMTQKVLAERTDTGQDLISMYINGRRSPKALTLYKISKVLNCTVEDLMDGVFEVM